MYRWISVSPTLEVLIETWSEPTLDGGLKPRWKQLAYIELISAQSAWVGHDSQDNEIGVKETNNLRAKLETEGLIFQKVAS